MFASLYTSGNKISTGYKKKQMWKPRIGMPNIIMKYLSILKNHVILDTFVCCFYLEAVENVIPFTIQQNAKLEYTRNMKF